MIPPPDREGLVPFRGHRTWFRVTGGGRARLPPLVVLHGGPGAAHDYTLRFAGLASAERAVVQYDQLGCGRSTHLPDQGGDFWTVDLFLDELDAVLAHLGIGGSYHLLGQSWGGMLGAEHAVRRPAGLRSLVIANSPPSIPLWVAEANRLRRNLPWEVQATLTRHEAAGTTGDAEYEAATMVYYARHVCRIQPFPAEVAASFAQLAAEPTVYHTMNGPSEFHCIGTLKHWSIIERLHRIAVPTLLISGAHDEATPLTQMPMIEQIRDVRWRMFAESSHMPHVEQTAECLAAVGTFIGGHDARA